MSEFPRAVGAVLARLRPGEVVTYGEVAAEAGFPGAARAVGTFLRDHDGYPWWRVVRADGQLVSSDPADQARRLATEGVTVVAWRGQLQVVISAARKPSRSTGRMGLDERHPCEAQQVV